MLGRRLGELFDPATGTVDGVDASGYRLADGVLTMPATPGFGLQIDW